MNIKPYFLKFLLVVLSCLSGCNKNQKEDLQLDFTHIENFDEAYSLRFTGTDTILVRQYWITNGPSENNKNYFAILDDSEKNRLRELIKEINISVLDTVYPKSSKLDGSFVGIFLKNDFQNATFYPHKRNESKEVKNLIEYISDIKKKLELKSTNSQIDYKSAPKIPPVTGKVGVSKFMPSEKL